MLLHTELNLIRYSILSKENSTFCPITKGASCMICVHGVISYQGAFSNLHFLVSPVNRISYRKGGKQKEKHSSLCLIHWAATVNVHQSGKDNFSLGRLPGTTLDHHLPSSLFSFKSMNKNAVKVCPIAKQCIIFCGLQQNSDF